MSTAMTWAGTMSPRRLASDDAPMIPRLLRTLLPITFPTTTSAWRFTAATKVVRNSGAEVLSAMTVGPITGFEIPNRSPVPTALARHTSRAGRYVSRPSENMLPATPHEREYELGPKVHTFKYRAKGREKPQTRHLGGLFLCPPPVASMSSFRHFWASENAL